jgi:hypothetical protein
VGRPEWTMAHAERGRRRSGAAVVSTPRCCGGVLRSVESGRANVHVTPSRFQLYAPWSLPVVLGSWHRNMDAALAYATVVLQANFTLVGDYINLATNALLAVGGILLVRRDIRCWNSARG